MVIRILLVQVGPGGLISASLTAHCPSSNSRIMTSGIKLERDCAYDHLNEDRKKLHSMERSAYKGRRRPPWREKVLSTREYQPTLFSLVFRIQRSTVSVQQPHRLTLLPRHLVCRRWAVLFESVDGPLFNFQLKHFPAFVFSQMKA